MDTLFMLFLGILCLALGVRVFCAEEQTKVFNKRNLPLTDVKKYNQLCGALIVGFGVVGEITFYFMLLGGGVWASFATIPIIVEAVFVMILYNKIEKKMIRKN